MAQIMTKEEIDNIIKAEMFRLNPMNGVKGSTRKGMTWREDILYIRRQEIMKLYGDAKKPVFLGGGMNANVGKDMMNKFCENWTIISQTELGSTVVTVTKPCIDFILQLNNKAKPVKVLGSAVIKQANSGDMKKASDHYPVYVDVKF